MAGGSDEGLNLYARGIEDICHLIIKRVKNCTLDNSSKRVVYGIINNVAEKIIDRKIESIEVALIKRKYKNLF